MNQPVVVDMDGEHFLSKSYFEDLETILLSLPVVPEQVLFQIHLTVDTVIDKEKFLQVAKQAIDDEFPDDGFQTHEQIKQQNMIKLAAYDDICDTIRKTNTISIMTTEDVNKERFHSSSKYEVARITLSFFNKYMKPILKYH